MRFERATEVEDIALHDRDLEHHLLFMVREDLRLDIVEVLGNVMEFRETGIEQQFDDVMEEVRRSLREIGPLAPFALAQFDEKVPELIDVVPVRGDDVVFGQDDVELAGIGGAQGGIEERRMDREEQAVLVLHGLGLIGRRDQLLDGEGMNVEILLQIGDIGGLRIQEIDPGEISRLDDVHISFPCCC